MKTTAAVLAGMLLLVASGCRQGLKQAVEELNPESKSLSNSEAPVKKGSDSSLDSRKKTLKDTVIRSESKSTGSVSEVPYKDGQKQGMARQFYPDGTLMKEVEYRQSKKHGVTRIYRKDGSLQRETHYRDGVLHGKLTRYFKSGNPRLEVEYDQGKPLLGYRQINYRKEVVPPPEVVVEREDHLADRGEYWLKVGLDQKLKNVKYFAFPEKTGYTNGEEPLKYYQLPTSSNRGLLKIPVPPGRYLALQVHIYVQFDLRPDVPVVIYHRENLAVENTY